MTPAELRENIARNKFWLYCEYGFGQSFNWLTETRTLKITREEVVESLRVESVRKTAIARRESLLRKAEELQELIAEAESLETHKTRDNVTK